MQFHLLIYSRLDNRLNLLCGLAHRRISPGDVNIHGLRPNQIRRTKQHSLLRVPISHRLYLQAPADERPLRQQ
jgi:hypothetical protein